MTVLLCSKTSLVVIYFTNLKNVYPILLFLIDLDLVKYQQMTEFKTC